MPSKNLSPSRADARDAILDAAEKVFSISGFDGASMKEVAAEAGVAQSLLHYHFGNKERLYVEVFERRAHEMNDIRNANLDLLVEAGDATVEDVLKILLLPPMQIGREDGGMNFPRLLIRVVLSGDEQSNNMVSRAFDPFARRVISLLRQTLPGISARDAVWGYTFALNVAMAMMAPTGRPQRLSDGECDDRDVDGMLQNVVLFAAAGLRAFAARASQPKAVSPSKKPKLKSAVRV